MWFARASTSGIDGADTPAGRFLLSLKARKRSGNQSMQRAIAQLLSLPPDKQPAELARLYLLWEK